MYTDFLETKEPKILFVEKIDNGNSVDLVALYVKDKEKFVRFLFSKESNEWYAKVIMKVDKTDDFNNFNISAKSYFYKLSTNDILQKQSISDFKQSYRIGTTKTNVGFGNTNVLSEIKDSIYASGDLIKLSPVQLAKHLNSIDETEASSAIAKLFYDLIKLEEKTMNLVENICVSH